jgi:large subunit ribosomal protein L25
VRLDQLIRAQVAVELVGESPGVKQGGVLTTLVREITVEALPLEMPDAIRLDLSETEIGSTLRVADLQVPESVKIFDDPESVLVTVSAPRLAAELEALEAEAAEAAAEALEGEEAEALEVEGEEGAEAEEPEAAEGGEAESSAE